MDDEVYFGSDFDLGSFEDIGAFDLGNMNFDFGNDWGFDFDPSALSLDDFSNYDYGDIDLSQIDPSTLGDWAADLGDIGASSEVASDLTRSMFPRRVNIEDPGSYRVPTPSDSNIFGSAGYDLGGFGDLEEADRQARLAAYGVQDLGTPDYPTDDQGLINLSGYADDRLPSQWQTIEGTNLRVMVQEDGTAIGMNPETGTTFSLTPEQVRGLVSAKKLNTFGSGYNTATGGNRVAPGGGTRLPDGSIKKPDGTIIRPDGSVKLPNGQVVKPGGGPTAGTPSQTGGQNDLLKLLLPLLLMMAMRDKGGSSSNAVIPALTASQTQTPYSQQRPQGYRPGQGGVTYFNPTQYTPRASAGGAITMADGGIVNLARMMAAQRQARGGRLLQGRGDGVSDSIPATIDGQRPARLARGEYVVDARTVAELGNGSTDAGAERLDEMRQRVHAKRKKAKVGQDSRAYKVLPA